MGGQTQTVVGAGPNEWIWLAIAAGDVDAVRAAPAGFDICSIHPKFGSVLTAFLQGLLNLEGRFVAESRPRLVRELIQELGRRGARPDAVIPSASIEVQGLYRSWKLTGDITALQAVIQMRNDLVAHRFDAVNELIDCESEATGAQEDAKMLTELVDKYAALAATPGSAAVGRILVPEAVVGFWERCFADGRAQDADLQLVSPDGQRTGAHAAVLSRASPVVATMLSSKIGCGRAAASSDSAVCPDDDLLTGLRRQRDICVQESESVVKLLLSVLYTGCLPADAGSEAQSPDPPTLTVGARVTVSQAFMSNSAKTMLLPAGLGGEVAEIDKQGDALVRFDGVSVRQWITRKNFWRLSSATAETVVQRQNDLAAALALAHFWQIDAIASLLADRLEREISSETLETTLQVATLHGAKQLRAACLAFAQHSTAVRTAFDTGAYGPTAHGELRALYEGGNRKRPREPL